VFELVAEGRAGPEGAAERLLAVVDLGEQPRVRTVRLGPGPAWWDAAHGIWVVDGEGLLRADSGERLVSLETPLRHLGPALPQRAQLVYDLDGDERAELLLWSAGALRGFDAAGAPLGSVPLPALGALEGGPALAGQRLGASLRSPIFTAADADGDGLQDILVIEGQRLVVHRTGPGCRLGASTAAIPLPIALEDPLFQDQDAYRYTTDAHLRDLDGDGRVDLLVHRVLSDGSLFGTRSELRAWRGTGAGFEGEQVLPLEGGSAEVYPADLDGDGDLELVSLEVALDASGLARSLLDGRVKVQLVARVMEGGRYGAPQILRELRVPIEPGQASWNLFGDLDGDGALDLALHREGEITVWRGQGLSFPDPPLLQIESAARVEELLVAELDGDGAAELVGWARGEAQLSVWSLR
jgi:hypothetical protein